MQLSPCPSAATLLRYTQSAPDRAIAAHLAACAACTTALAELRVISGAMRSSPLAALPGDECLDEMAVARIVEGGAAPAELAHAARCATCRGRIADVAAATSAGPVAAEIERLDAPRRSAWGRRALGIGGVAAAAVLALVLTGQPPRGDSEGTVYRDPASVTPAAPVVVHPIDVVVARPVQLRWRTTLDATQYQVTVFDAEGSVMWNVETSDTAVVIPETVQLADGVAYWWRIEARVGFDRWSHSDVTPFTLGPKAR